jgi:hypothetical protein
MKMIKDEEKEVSYPSTYPAPTMAIFGVLIEKASSRTEEDDEKDVFFPTVFLSSRNLFFLPQRFLLSSVFLFLF